MDLSDDKDEILYKTLYSYIGYNNVEKTNDEIIDNIEDIKLMEIPKTLDKWFIEFNNNLEKKSKKSKYKNRFRNIISKVAIVFLILFISIAALTVTVDAFRVKLFNIIMKNTEKYLNIEANDESKISNIKENIEGYYQLGYIPNGFMIDSVQDLGDTKIITYINNNNEEIIFNQSLNGTNFQMDSEDAIVKEVDISRNKGVILTKDGMNTLFWYNEESSFYLLSNMNQEELITMGESIIKK